VLREVLEELGSGPGAVGQLQLLQLLQLHQAGQQRAACSEWEQGSGSGPRCGTAGRCGERLQGVAWREGWGLARLG
jgi:hypothetical protein